MPPPMLACFRIADLRGNRPISVSTTALIIFRGMFSLPLQTLHNFIGLMEGHGIGSLGHRELSNVIFEPLFQYLQLRRNNLQRKLV